MTAERFVAAEWVDHKGRSWPVVRDLQSFRMMHFPATRIAHAVAGLNADDTGCDNFMWRADEVTS